MIEKNRELHKRWFILMLCLITLVGFGLRIKCCFWGNPVLLHPDESATVDYAIDLLQRHSYLAQSFDRPDHFEIKCDALIFALVSKVLYHSDPYDAFLHHIMAFYILARMFTAVFGTALIPLTAIFTGQLMARSKERTRRIAQLLAAAFIAFSSTFICNSSWATPDIVLTFFVVLFALGLTEYMANRNRKALLMSIVIIGIGLTIKYTAAILCLPLALAVIWREWIQDGKVGRVFSYGFLSIGVILAVVFAIGPNLITDFPTVVENFIEEARPNHLGADGLSFGGNLMYYYRDISGNLNGMTAIFALAGLVYIFRNRNCRWFSLLVGAIYISCMSVMALHWSRWGIPAYPFYIILAAVGMAGCLEWVTMLQKQYRMSGLVVIWAVTGLLVCNVFLGGLAEAKFRSLPDTCYLALAPLDEMNVTRENTLYEGYTPFAPAHYAGCVDSFAVQDGKVKIKIENASKKYFMMSEGFKSRYKAAPDRYPEQCAVYDGIDAQYEMVYRLTPDNYKGSSSNLLRNIALTVKYLATDFTSAGGQITVYDLAPKYITLCNAEGMYLSENEAGEIVLSDQASSWVVYDISSEEIALIGSKTGEAIESVPNGVKMTKATGEKNQQWHVIEVGDRYALVNENNEGLTVEEDAAVLREYSGLQNQLWKLERK